MQFHVRGQQGTHGPYSIEQLRDLIDRGQIAHTDEAWAEGSTDWIPVSQIEGIYARPAPVFAPEPIKEGAQVRPWARYWARVIDSVIIGIIVGIPLSLLAPTVMSNPVIDQFIFCLSLMLWIPIEAFLLSTFGYMPGKALLRVRVSNRDDSNLSFAQALLRSFRVWLIGLGTGVLGLLTLVTSITSYRTLTNQGVTSWDLRGHFEVTHRPVGVIRVLIVIGFFVGLIALSAIGLAIAEE